MARYEITLSLPEGVVAGNVLAQRLLKRQRGELLEKAMEGRWSIYEHHADVIATPFDLTLSEIWHTAYSVTLRVDVEDMVR